MRERKAKMKCVIPENNRYDIYLSGKIIFSLNYDEGIVFFNDVDFGASQGEEMYHDRDIDDLDVPSEFDFTIEFRTVKPVGDKRKPTFILMYDEDKYDREIDHIYLKMDSWSREEYNYLTSSMSPLYDYLRTASLDLEDWKGQKKVVIECFVSIVS